VPSTRPPSVRPSSLPLRAIPKSVTFYASLVVEQDVLRLDVAMHDPRLCAASSARATRS